MKSNKRGVTLLELVVVFAIIAIGAVLAVPNIGPWITHYRLRTATRDITSTLRVAQMRAVSNNMEHRVSFDPVARTYILQRNSGGWVDEGAAQTLPTGISIATNFGNTLTFNPNSSTTPGITSDITLQNTKGTQRIIRVLSSTGRIFLP
jgi:prepilin-type N-terminal cleavage/methylation domain-containing protein